MPCFTLTQSETHWCRVLYDHNLLLSATQQCNCGLSLLFRRKELWLRKGRKVDLSHIHIHTQSRDVSVQLSKSVSWKLHLYITIFSPVTLQVCVKCNHCLDYVQHFFEWMNIMYSHCQGVEVGMGYKTQDLDTAVWDSQHESRFRQQKVTSGQV